MDPKIRVRTNPTYNIYTSMLRRCRTRQSYIRRGVCERWKQSYFNFLEDMGPRPEGLWLERVDNDKGYSKENCCWATPKQQARNKSSNVVLTLDGETKTLIEWSEQLGLPAPTLYSRVSYGWSDEDVLTKPLQREFAGNQWTPPT